MIENKTTEMTRMDLHHVLMHVPRDIQEIVREQNLFLAGGFIRSIISGEPPCDIDLFGDSKGKLQEIAEKLASDREGKCHNTDNAYTVLAHGRTPIQFIHRWLYADAQKLTAEFDFTIARAVIWFDKASERWVSLCADSYYADLAGKRLVYCKPEREEEAGGSLMRVRKFLGRGYWISASELGKVVTRLIAAVDFTKDPSGEMLEKIIIGLLREVDPLNVIDGVDLVNEHESIPSASQETGVAAP